MPKANLYFLLSTIIVMGFPFLSFSEEPSSSLFLKNSEFNRQALVNPLYSPSTESGFSLLNPNRFSIRQSYSLNFSGSSLGSSSGGLYLNTLSYKLADPLTLFVDVGIHTPLYSSVADEHLNAAQFERLGSSIILPQIGLEYKPTKNTMLSIQYVNMDDASKAYGPSLFHRPWWDH